MGRQGHAAPEPAALHPVEHPSGRARARCARQRHRGRPDAGGRRPGVDPQRRTAAGANAICGLFGSTIAFTPAQLASLYGTKGNYIVQYTKSLDKAIASGYILSADKASLLAQAEQVQFPA